MGLEAGEEHEWHRQMEGEEPPRREPPRIGPVETERQRNEQNECEYLETIHSTLPGAGLGRRPETVAATLCHLSA